MDNIERTIEELKHCKEVGNIIFQAPEDEEIIDTIIQALKKQIPIKLKEIETKWLPIYKCKCENIIDWATKDEFSYCPICGQKLEKLEEIDKILNS